MCSMTVQELSLNLLVHSVSMIYHRGWIQDFQIEGPQTIMNAKHEVSYGWGPALGF